MNIAVLGASFDPAHNGHLAVARSILKSRKADKIMLMPVNIHPFPKTLSKARHRLAMARLLQDNNIEVSDLELGKDSVSFSIDTLRTLQQKYPHDKFYWIIGSDHLDSFTKWKNWMEILTDFGLIIAARDVHTNIEKEIEKNIGNKKLEKNIIILNAKDFPPVNISSSEIRRKIKNGESMSGLVPKAVENYIIQHRLYL